MSLKIGIVGLPNVCKSTLFNALTKNKAEASNYPFCTIDPNVGVVKVPDERLGKLATVSKPKKIIPTTIEFIDIAGLVSGAHKGEGLGNKFLANIRECDAICEVVRNFEDKNITHVAGKIDPEEDRETINIELIMADLATVKDLIKLKAILEPLKVLLESGKPARELDIPDDDKPLIKGLNLLSAKPVIYVLNNSDQTEIDPDWDGELINLDVKQEEEIANLDEKEQKEFIKELGLSDSGLNKLIKASYKLLGLITFFTTGPDETRAWTVRTGAMGPEAAGVIHTDFEKGFIRAEVINWEEFIKAGSEAAAREQGIIRTEGKNYIMQDGDVCHFLFSN